MEHNHQESMLVERDGNNASRNEGENERGPSPWASAAATTLPLADDRSNEQQMMQTSSSGSGGCRCGGEQKKKVKPLPFEGAPGVEMLGSELNCAICHQLFVEAATIGCGHSFCRMCIDNWLKTKLTCPICRAAIDKPPINSVCLDKAVRAVLDIAQERDIEKELEERKKQASMVRESECLAQNSLELLYQRAIEQGVRVVQITRVWSKREQRRFLDGIERHQGTARETYCKVVGLTCEWVAKATIDQLLVAATNVDLKDIIPSSGQPSSSCPWRKDACARKLRARLEMYIRYG